MLPAPLTPSRMVGGGGCSWVGGVLPGWGYRGGWGPPGIARFVSGGPFDVHQDRPVSGASPQVLDGMQGCQYRMTSHDHDYDCPDFSPAYGVQMHDPRFLEYVGAPKSARLLSRSPEYSLHHLGHEKTLGAALQLQHDAGLILSNVQVLQQLVTSFNASCGSPLVGRRFRRTLCNRWCPHTGFAGRLIIWRPWDCGGRLVLKEFGDPCRQRHTMPACRAVTVFRRDYMDSMFAFLCVRHVTVQDFSCAGCIGLSCRDWTVIVVSLYSMFTFR